MSTCPKTRPCPFKAAVVATRPSAAEPEVLLITSRHSWIFPVGTVEPGESLERAAARECAEESGYTVEIGRLDAQIGGAIDSPSGWLERAAAGRVRARYITKARIQSTGTNFRPACPSLSRARRPLSPDPLYSAGEMQGCAAPTSRKRFAPCRSLRFLHLQPSGVRVAGAGCPSRLTRPANASNSRLATNNRGHEHLPGRPMLHCSATRALSRNSIQLFSQASSSQNPEDQPGFPRPPL